MRILAYHEISDTPSDPTHGVSVMAFREQMTWLANHGYQIAPLGRRDPGRKTLGIMFDDGYLDMFTNAWPILREHGFVATVFLVSSRVGGALQSKQEWKAAPLMDWDQVRELAQHGISFGSHSHTHADLTRIPLDAVVEELWLSRQIIETELESHVDLFSVPWSKMNEDVAEQVYAQGYAHTFRFSPFYPGTRRGRYGESPGTGILSYDGLDEFRQKVQGRLSRWIDWRVRQAKALVRQRPLPDC
jgi:peptidoglycan/xylan/chitin deacetylase (PgdA/CDA1 family)